MQIQSSAFCSGSQEDPILLGNCDTGRKITGQISASALRAHVSNKASWCCCLDWLVPCHRLCSCHFCMWPMQGCKYQTMQQRESHNLTCKQHPATHREMSSLGDLHHRSYCSLSILPSSQGSREEPHPAQSHTAHLGYASLSASLQLLMPQPRKHSALVLGLFWI